MNMYYSENTSIILSKNTKTQSITVERIHTMRYSITIHRGKIYYLYPLLSY